MRFSFTFLVFLFLNLGALLVGMLLMNNGPTSQWYSSLVRAPWEPAGWVFGAAWTSVMVFFSVFMTFLYQNIKLKKLIALYILHLVLNVSWNYIFMNKHMILFGLFNIILLSILMFYFFIAFKELLKNMRFFVLPYCAWLILATSLNLYIAIFN